VNESFRPSFSRVDERIDMRPFSEAGTSMIGSEELGRVQSALLKHVPVGGHRHHSHVAKETAQHFTDFADLMAVSSHHLHQVFLMRSNSSCDCRGGRNPNQQLTAKFLSYSRRSALRRKPLRQLA
jgi:hypothetical protein